MFYLTGFIQPSFELLQDIRNQGEVIINSRSNGSNNFQQSPTPSNGSQTPQAISAPLARQQPRTSQSSPSNGDQLLWDSSNEASNGTGNGISHVVTAAKTYASIVKPAAQISGQCIPGSSSHISVKPALTPSKCKKLLNFHLLINI